METNPAKISSEIEEKSRDLAVFMAARDLIRKRVMEVVDSNAQLTPLPYWSGTDAVLGSLDLAIHSMERTIAELEDLLSEVRKDGPSLVLISGGIDVQD